MSNRNYNTQTNPNRQKLMNGGRAKKNMGGSMNPAMARQDMASGYYPSDMGMEGGAMYKKGGSVKKKMKKKKSPRKRQRKPLILMMSGTTASLRKKT